VEALVSAVLAKDAARPLGDVLAELGLKDVVSAQAKEVVGRRIAAVVGGDAFAEWLGSLLG
jgi:hypothetical protein